VPNTGKRNLSFVYDDYAPTAKNIQGIPLGNGNLMYTVAHDAASGKHTARFESYTSFNMPREIQYTNIGANVDVTLAQANARAGTATGNPAGLTSDRTLSFVYGPEHQRPNKPSPCRPTPPAPSAPARRGT
jgi:hypothetical protein